MKKKITISVLIAMLAYAALIIIAPNAKADDPCFDGMCVIEYNATTYKTTYTRLSDAEIVVRLKAKIEQDRLTAVAKAEQDRLAALAEANKPKPVVIYETVTAIPATNNTSVTVTINATATVNGTTTTNQQLPITNVDTTTVTTKIDTATTTIQTKPQLNYSTIDWQTIDLFTFDWNEFWIWFSESIWWIKL
jgi:hypothetical protein